MTRWCSESSNQTHVFGVPAAFFPTFLSCTLELPAIKATYRKLLSRTACTERCVGEGESIVGLTKHRAIPPERSLASLDFHGKELT
jgi:hypothetical protein